MIIALALATITGAYAQQTSKEAKKAAKQAEKEARALHRTPKNGGTTIRPKGAKARDFVLEANQLVFKALRGQTSYVNPNTNFTPSKAEGPAYRINNNAVAGANGLGA